MIRWAIIFFIVALVAVALGLGGIAPLAAEIGYVLLVVGVILFIVHLIAGRRVV